jgi:hypothetical protein
VSSSTRAIASCAFSHLFTDYSEAEALYERILVAREKNLGMRHEYTLDTLANVRASIDDQGGGATSQIV